MKKRMWDVYVYGDVNIDLVLPGVREVPPYGQEWMVETMGTYVGGGSVLTALGLGKLGMRPAFQGTVGADCYGTFIRSELERANVDSSLLRTSDTNKTGISISFTDAKDRSFLTYMGTNQEVDMSRVDLGMIRHARHIHVTGYAGRASHDTYRGLLEKVKAEGLSTSFDVGWDDSGEWYEGITELMPYIDVLFMNETEAMHYGRTDTALEALEKFAQMGAIAAGKLGVQGSVAVKEGQVYRAPAYKVEAVDTTGAGDSFNAGFIYGYLNGMPIEDCLRYGNGCGALSVTGYGGNTAFPTLEVLEKFISETE